MGIAGMLSNIASYGFATVPILIFVLWTWLGNWYTYSLGWMIMILDLGLWMLDMPSTAYHIVHFNVTTEGWRWYYVCAEWIILVAMTWRGYVMIRELYLKKKEAKRCAPCTTGSTPMHESSQPTPS
jgi:hypothetical protein